MKTNHTSFSSFYCMILFKLIAIQNIREIGCVLIEISHFDLKIRMGISFNFVQFYLMIITNKLSESHHRSSSRMKPILLGSLALVHSFD